MNGPVVDDEELEDEEDEVILRLFVLVLMLVLILVLVEVELVLGGGVYVEVGVWVVDGGVYCEVEELVVVVDEPESLPNDHDPVTSPIVLGSPIK